MKSAYKILLPLLSAAIIATACGTDDTETPVDGDADSVDETTDDGADMDVIGDPDAVGDPDADPIADPDMDPIPDPDAEGDGAADTIEDSPTEDAPADMEEDGPAPSLLGVHFYGNRGTWGSLGLDDEGTMWPDVDAVVARYASLCEQARIDSGLGETLRCGADLIGYAPTGYLSVTEDVADRLISEYDARITIDIRTSGSLSFAEVYNIVERIFSGESSIVSNDFLEAHPIGLSLDYEPQIVDGPYTSVTASVANEACGAHRDLMTARGHDPDELWCFLYEFGNPPMMADGYLLDPWVFPVLMSATCGRTGDGDTPEERQAALDLKEGWIDNVAAEYSNTDITGCMLFLVPYLMTGQRDQFTFVEAIEAFGDKCDVFSFQ